MRSSALPVLMPKARGLNNRVATVPVIAGVWLVAIVLVVVIDTSLLQWIQSWAADGSVARRILKIARYPVSTWGFVALAVALALHRQNRAALVGLVVALATSTAAVHMLKFLVGRARPDLGVDPLVFVPFGDPRVGFDSFPSGHATSAVLCAVLAARYFPGTGFLLFPAAALACLSRVAQDRHYVSDIVAGVGLALLTVYLCRLWLGEAYYAPRRVLLTWSGRWTRPRSAAGAAVGGAQRAAAERPASSTTASATGSPLE